MSTDDPFAEPEESEHTVIRPTPGGRRGAAPEAGAPAGAPQAPPPLGDGEPLPVPLIGVNALVSAASPILHLAVRLKSSVTHNDVEGLRTRVVAEVKAFERRAAQAGVSAEVVRAARYALSATIDDLVLNTPWGSASLWTKQSMVSTFHKETFGGERFFDLLEMMNRDPARNLEMLELLYLCITLGFEGRFRVAPRGATQLSEVRDSLYRTIRLRRGDFERDLSPHWKGIAVKHVPFGANVPLWVLAITVAVALTLMYAAFSLALNRKSDEAFARLGALQPTEPLVFSRPEPPKPPPSTQLSRIKGFLEDEIRAGLVSVFEDNSSITVRITGSGMFPSGSDQVEPRFLPIITRIGDALNDEAGKVLIAGYTDNVPIRTLRFPSNWQLSLARAQSVQRLLADHLKDAARLSSQGFGETHPIAANATTEGRNANRRIEVVLMTENPQAVLAPQPAIKP